MKKIVLIFFVVALVLISGCAKPDGNGQKGKCGDGICEPIERQTGKCQDDCG